MCCQDSAMDCLKRKHELVDYHSLPSYMKDNEFIHNYYRCEWPLKQTILSIFYIHNETLNIWTHLIGFFMFLSLTISSGLMMQGDREEEYIALFSRLTLPLSEYIAASSSSSWGDHQVLAFCPETNGTDHACSPTRAKENETSTMALSSALEQPTPRWPFFAFMCGAMFCLFTSSACHLLSCHSKQYSCIMLRLDYTGISALIVTSFYPLVYYSFMCHPFFRSLYIGLITIIGMATAFVLMLPVFQAPNYRLVRSALFAVMGLSGFVPIVHKLVAFSHQPEALVTTGYELLMGAFYVFGVAIYVARIPERWMPGKFDIAGHSHQLFHVLVIAGACTHYLGGLVYLNLPTPAKFSRCKSGGYRNPRAPAFEKI